MFCEQLEGRQLLSASLIGFYQGSVSVKLGGITETIDVNIDITPINGHKIKVQGNIDGISFPKTIMTGSINSSGYFDYSAMNGNSTAFGEFSGNLDTIGSGKHSVQVLIGSATIETTLGGVFTTVSGKYELDQIYPLPVHRFLESVGFLA